MKRLFRDKRGMTLTEIVVAVTILMLVIVGTTPVLLSSYDSLYTAGEYTSDTYEAKSEIEDTLATRNSLNIIEGFKVNFEGLGEVAKINAKRAVSSLYNSLETLFTGGRGHVAIVSSKVINDDKLSHDVILQTTNIFFKDSTEVSYNSPDRVTAENPTKKVDVSVYLPDKTKTVLAEIYATRATGEKGVSGLTVNPATGRIYVQVKGVEFTNSPAKIEVTYRDENNKVRRTSCYLTIKTPTIMLAGNRLYGDYYTTAGVEVKKNSDGSETKTLEVAARRMDISGVRSGYTKPIPDGTIFKSVNWITEQVNGEFVDSVYEPGYYVLTGTNGAIYRTYSMKEYNTGTNAVRGKINLAVSSNDQAGFTAKFHSVISQSGADVLGIADSVFTLDDQQNSVVYPAFWGGDFSHIFGYSAFGEQAGYTNRTEPSRSSIAWYTEDTNNNGIGLPGYYSNFATLSYYYNGWALSTKYTSMNSRKISYILTEQPYALRVGGFMGDVGSVDNYGYDGTSFDRIWEQPNYASGDHINELKSIEAKFRHSVLYSYTQCWYYAGPNSSMPRSTIIRSNNDKDGNINENAPYHTLPVYFANHNPHSDSTKRGDHGFAQLRIKALTTVSPTIVYERGDHKDSSTDMRIAYNTDVNKSKVIVTDGLYVPGKGMVYIGSTAAYGWITQVDNVGTNDSSPDVQGMKNNGTSNTGSPAFYWVESNDEGTQTTVFKTCNHSDSGVDWSGKRSLLINSATHDGSAAVEANSTGTHQFFVAQPANGTVSSKLFSDVMFTIGYASNREMFYTNMVYGRDTSGNLIQSLKFCEPFYFQSHYDDDEHIPYLFMNGVTDTSGVTGPYLNVPDNDYYNVWFPGEMYNLTKAVTKDGVAVSVGYAVAGSAYTYLNTVQNASTALGGIHNDGVLTAMVLGTDTAFTNLLYFKDTENFDNDSLSNGEVTYRNYASMGISPYGTHARDSIQFTDVDISIEYVKSGSNEVATYYAYYADNKGRLYKSKIATKTTALNATTGGTPQMVSHIADEPYDGTRSAPSYMEEIKINGNSVNTYLSKITSVSCEGDYIIVGGHSADGNHNLIVGKIQQSEDQLSNSITWKYVKISGASPYKTEDILTLEGYTYLTGVSYVTPSLTRGYLCAISLEDISYAANGADVPFLFVGDENLQDPIYAIDGHS